MSDSVGKISLDLEITSDLQNQIGKVSEAIGKNLKDATDGALKSTAKSVDDNIKKSINKTTSNMKNSISKMGNSLKKQMSNLFSSLKNIKIPTPKFDKPENESIPKGNVKGQTSGRAPPKVNTNMNAEALKAQIDNVSATLDNINARIEQQQAKLAQLRESYKMAFNPNTKNKIEEQMLKTEAVINKLTGQSDKLGFKLADLDEQFAKMSSAASKSTSGLNAVNDKLKQTAANAGRAGQKATELSSKIKQTGNATRAATNHTNYYSHSIGNVMRQMMTWMIVLPMVVSGLKSMATGLLNNLKTNQEFSTSLAQIKSNLMIAFTPIYYAILPAINALMHALSVVTQYIASFISAIFGKTFNQSKQATQQLIDAKQAMGVYGDSAKKAGTAAKKAGDEARKGLMGFDEINVLGSKNKSDSGDDSGGVPQLVTPPLQTAPVDSAMKKLVDRIKSVMSTIGSIFMDGFNNAFGNVDWDGIKKEIQSIGDSLKEIFSDPKVVSSAKKCAKALIYNLGMVTGSVASIGVSIADNLLGGLAKYLSGNKGYIKNMLVQLFDVRTETFNIIGNFSKSIATIFTALRSDVAKGVTANIIGIVVNTLLGAEVLLEKIARDILNVLTKPFIDNAGKFKTAIENLLAPIESVTSGILTVITGALEDLNKMYDEHVKPLFDSIANGLSEIVGAVLDVFNNTIAPVLKDIGKDIENFLSTSLRPMFTQVSNIIGNIVDIIKGLWNNILKPVILWLIQNILPVVGPILKGAWELVKKCFNIIAPIIKSLLKIIEGITEFLAGVFTGDWKRAWNGVAKIFSGFADTIRGVINGLRGIFNTVIDIITWPFKKAWEGIQWVIGKLKHAFDFNWKLPHIPLPHFHVNGSLNPLSWIDNGIPSIGVNWYARGGVFNSPQLIGVGEHGKEAVMPLENNTGWIDTLAQKVSDRMPKGEGSDNKSKQPVILQLYVGTKKVAEEIVEDINKVTKSTGVCPIRI